VRGPIGVALALLTMAVVAVVLRSGSGVALPGSVRSAQDAVTDAVTNAAPTRMATSAAAGAVPRAPATRGPYRVLALGDSVPAGSVCTCRPFPQIYGSLLRRRRATSVAVDNLAVGGLDTAGLIRQLGRARYADSVRRSNVIVVTIGANDFGDHHRQVVDGRCGGGDTDCVADEVHALRAHLITVLTRIRALRGSGRTTVLVTGYWNVFQDGDVAVQQVGQTGLTASRRLTARANAVIQSVSRAEGTTYVDLFKAFDRAGRSLTSLLASDGDHPNADGHRLIAHALLDAGLPAAT